MLGSCHFRFHNPEAGSLRAQARVGGMTKSSPLGSKYPMPKLIDWGVRFDLMREAIVRIAARDGASAVCLASVAAELQISSSTLRRALSSPDVLPDMGVLWIARQRVRRTWRRGPQHGTEHGSVEHAIWCLVTEVPMHEEDVERERAWMHLTAAGASERTRKMRAEHDEVVDQLVRGVLVLIGSEAASRDHHATRLRALVDGLTLALCRSSITPEQARECLDAHLREVPREPELPVSLAAGGSPR